MWTTRLNKELGSEEGKPAAGQPASVPGPAGTLATSATSFFWHIDACVLSAG